MKKNIIIVTIMIGIIFLNILNVKADSGFDTSYGGSSYSGGSSWSSGSSSSSRSSWSSSDNDYYSRRSNNYSGRVYNGTRTRTTTCKSDDCKKMAKWMAIISSILLIIVPIASLITFIVASVHSIINRKKRRDIENIPTTAYELFYKTKLTEEQVQKVIPWFNKEKFLEESYNIYLKVQEDWMNFNYEGLKENLTDELYNQYKMQLDTLKEKNQKNIMKDFELIQEIITDVKEENSMYIITTEMVVKFIDYIEENEIPVRGSALCPVIINYKITYIRSNRAIDKCPNCGAPINENASQICDYCRGQINRPGDKWIMSKKESLSQR